jgi:hypothetical protein
MEKAQDDYSASQVVPVVLSVKGPTSVYQTEVRTYEPNYYRAGSKWTWTVTGAILDSTTADTRKIFVDFKDKPANDTAIISVYETTSGGTKSATKIIQVKVKDFCALDINNFLGAFDCDEEGYGVYTVNFTQDPVLANTILNDNFWDYAGPGAVIKYTLSGDFLETVTVPHQTFVFGDDTEGWVEGSGTYSGCSHTMIVDYTVLYDGDEYSTHHEFSPGTKGNFTVVKKKSPGNIK